MPSAAEVFREHHLLNTLLVGLFEVWARKLKLDQILQDVGGTSLV